MASQRRAHRPLTMCATEMATTCAATVQGMIRVSLLLIKSPGKRLTVMTSRRSSRPRQDILRLTKARLYLVLRLVVETKSRALLFVASRGASRPQYCIDSRGASDALGCDDAVPPAVRGLHVLAISRHLDLERIPSTEVLADWRPARQAFVFPMPFL